jgi:hypothetical protein
MFATLTQDKLQRIGLGHVSALIGALFSAALAEALLSEAI